MRDIKILIATRSNKNIIKVSAVNNLIYYLRYIQNHFKNPLFRNAYLAMVGAISNSALGFIFWIVIARFYSTEAVGLNSAIVSSVGLLAVLSELGFGIGLIRFLPSAGKNSNDMLNTCLTSNGLTSMALAIFFLLGLHFWSPALIIVRKDNMFSAIFIIFTVVISLQSLALNAFLAMREAKFLVYYNMIFNLLKLAFAILFAVFVGTTFGLFFSICSAGVISLLVAIMLFLPKLQKSYYPIPKIKKEVLSELWDYSLSNYIGRGLMLITPLILPLIIVNRLGAEMNAYFAISWAVASILMVIPSSISTSLFVEGSHDRASLKHNSAKSLKLMFLLLVPITFFIFIISDRLLMIFGQDYSDNGAMLLRILALSSIPYGINYFYINISRITNNIKSLIKVTMATTCLSLGFSYILMLKMDLLGVGIGYLTGQTIVALAVFVFLWRCYLRVVNQL